MAKPREVPAEVEHLGADLGRVLGVAQAKAQARAWIGQRHEIVQHLTDIRDAASRLLADLGHVTRTPRACRARV